MTTTTHDVLSKFMAANDHPANLLTEEFPAAAGRLDAHQMNTRTVFVAFDWDCLTDLVNVYREAQANGVELSEILDPIRDLFGMDDLP